MEIYIGWFGKDGISRGHAGKNSIKYFYNVSFIFYQLNVSLSKSFNEMKQEYFFVFFFRKMKRI